VVQWQCFTPLCKTCPNVKVRTRSKFKLYGHKF
jgi:hypothetical protein